MGFVVDFIFSFLEVLSKGLTTSLSDSTIPTLNLLRILCCVYGYFYIHTIILNKIMFKPYKRITIDTEMKTISNKFTVSFTGFTILSIIPTIGIAKLVFSFVSSYMISMILCFIINSFIGYGFMNWFLSKYITVSEIEK
ncbi:MAG: hypothetical protein IJ848_00055 [Alphaproteobacteria bacterium]|nr:hypothetical protein [Alphaproteobacteria bacterium]